MIKMVMGNFSNDTIDDHVGGDPGVSLLFNLELERYKWTFMFVAFVTTIGILLLLFHESFLHKLTEKIPESCLLIILGLFNAFLVYEMSSEEYYRYFEGYISAEKFFDILLPPM